MPLHFAAETVVLQPVVSGTSSGDHELLVRALVEASRQWNRALEGCPAPRFRVDEVRGQRARWREDRVNEVVLHLERFCPPDGVDEGDCHEPGVHGTTRLYLDRTPVAVEGQLIEADIAINGVEHRWSEDGTLNLTALLAHELGHVLGLDHPCEPQGPQLPGAPAPPRCAAPPRGAGVMHPNAATVRGRPGGVPGRSEAALVCETARRVGSR